MNDQKNLILAVVLSALVLFGWSAISERFFPTANPAATKTAAASDVVLPKGSVPAAGAAPAIRNRDQVLAETPRLKISTPNLVGSINLKGARIDDLVLANPLYTDTIKPGSPPVRLFSPSGTAKAYFAQVGWTGPGAPPADAVWTASATELTPAKPVTLSWTSPAGQTYEIVLAVDNKFMFTATQRVVNRGAGAIAVQPYALVSRAGKSADPDAWTAHVGLIGVFDDLLRDVNYDEASDAGTITEASRGGWIGFTDKYWLAAVIPDQKARIDAAFRHSAGDRFQTDFAGQPKLVGPGQQATTTTHVFAGAKEVRTLDGYEETLGIPLFGRAIDWGWFEIIAKPIFYLLDWLFVFTGNFGVAIIGLTIIVRIAMFPIANKQFASMARMRIIAPKMKELQERYKDDRVRMQQEVMKLYQTEKVNPLAGCLPILLQIPIFYALYKTLMLSIEMRHQPFVLWIKDLSAPDPLTPVNLFGLLPFTPPQFIAIGVLPILLGITMWLQQKLNPAPMDEIQQKVFAILPWVFMVIMAPFAAGLQLYWTTNNILSIGQQWWLYKKHGAPVTEPAKS
ncbi:MAG: membrane protein insertase YidC [Alphaproteobacteria bacterium]|nr:membrane protein insertase YidC [Alphaproteobacteria bacterium]